MGFFFRKSINLGGGLRLNLSKGGVGLSAGLKGLRLGISPGGRRYVQCGRGGFYYRKSWQGGGARSAPISGIPVSPAHPLPARPPAQHYVNPPIPFNTLAPERIIDSGDVGAMVNSTAMELLAEINRRYRRTQLHRWWILVTGAVMACAAWNQWPGVVVGTLLAVLIGTPAIWHWDRRRKSIELYYELEADYAGRYQQLLRAFQAFCVANRIWVIEAEAEVRDRKYHAGATRSLKRQAVTPQFKLPPFFRSNATPPMLPAGRQTLYLFPDSMLVFDSGRIGAVAYDQLDSDSAAVTFVEEETVPRDSRQVGTTWRFVNKGGGPDQRFRDNRQLPVMEYGVVRCRSGTGLNEEFQTSRPDAALALDAGLRAMGQTAGRRPRIS